MPSRDSVTVRSPGKLFLLGEYAVLYGSPAIVQAVDRYVEVSVEPVQDAEAPAIEVCSLGADLAPLTAEMDGKLLFGPRLSGHDLVAAILEALAVHGVFDSNPGAIKCVVDSRALFHQNNKLGLGSSAAITHALAKAIFAFVSSKTRVEPLPKEFVFNVHRAFQEGRGSGADVGAGVMGGTFSFRCASPNALPSMASVQLPSDLHMIPVWAGSPASTSEALSTLSGFQSKHPDQFGSALTPLMELAESGCQALVQSHTERFMELCAQYSHNLSEFGRTVGVDIMSASHRELRKMATNSGVVYKPSGAGNGDIGIGYSRDIKALERFADKVVAAGFDRLELGSGRACHQLSRQI